MSVSCVMQGPDPSLAYRPNIEPKKTKEEYRNFEVMMRKRVCFMRDIFDCELLNGQNDECKSGTDASDGNDLSTTVVVALSLPLFWHCLLKKNSNVDQRGKMSKSFDLPAAFKKKTQFD